MKRTYSTGVDDQSVEFFVGTEIEKTPAYGKKTLFVVGLQPVELILTTAEKTNVEHIYLGANHSFDGQDVYDWHFTIARLTQKEYWVTLDFDAIFYADIIKLNLKENEKFIPVVSVKMPYINELGKNAHLKIDDVTFNYSNAGVWVHNIQNLKSDIVFTDWSEYTKDEIVK